MHFASAKLIGKMALGEAGLWATRINHDRDLVLVVKAPTDTIKWIQRGVAVELVIGHIKLGKRTVRCIALQVSDSSEDPVLVGGPQNLTEDHAPFTELLGKSSFTVYFHNENPFISILGGIAKPDQSAIRAYLDAHKADPLYGDPTNFGVFRAAQELFECSVLIGPSVPDSSFPVYRIPLRIERMAWNSVGMPDSGKFEPGNPNEGGSQEDLLVHVLKPHFQGIVAKGPQIPDGKKTRELCDVLAFSESYLFAFESKVFAVFEKFKHQTPERRAKTIFGHFEKAANQLEGAIKRIEQGVVITDGAGKTKEIRLSDFKATHAVVLVTTSNWKLPWNAIGHKLQQLSNTSLHFHFITAMELQRFVAHCIGDPLEMHLLLERRAEVIRETGNANVQTDFLPKPPAQLRLPDVPDSNRALEFAVDACQTDLDGKRVGGVLDQVLSLLRMRRFTGRVEIRCEGGTFHGTKVLWFVVAAGGSYTAPFDGGKEWWFSLLREIRVHCDRNILPVPLRFSGRIRQTSVLRGLFPDLLVTVEFESGWVTTQKYGQ